MHMIVSKNHLFGSFLGFLGLVTVYSFRSADPSPVGAYLGIPRDYEIRHIPIQRLWIQANGFYQLNHGSTSNSFGEDSERSMDIVMGRIWN